MSRPIVNLVSVINNVLGASVTTSTVTFQFYEDVVQWVVCVGGNDPFEGTVVGKGGNVYANTPITISIGYTSLIEGTNKVNIYGLSATGEWTPYITD